MILLTKRWTMPLLLKRVIGRENAMNIANIKLPIAVIGVILAQAFGIIWYVAQLASTVGSNTEAIESMEVFDDTGLLEAVEEFDNRLDEIEKQQAIIENEMRTIMSDHSVLMMSSKNWGKRAMVIRGSTVTIRMVQRCTV